MKKKLRRFSERNGFLSVLYNLPRLAKGYQPIFLDYRVRPAPRYGYGKPPHAEMEKIFAQGDAGYRASLGRWAERYGEAMREIPLRVPRGSAEPCWVNKWLDGLDTFALYGMVAERRPRLYVETGSGYSTKVVRRAIRDQGLGTKVISIDPAPRAEIDGICDEVVRRPLEDCDPGLADALEAGDIFFLDSSHRSFMNSDVTVFFLEILPRLKPGVVVHIHDIYLPLDYMPERAHWYYSEQYLLAASLLAGHANFKVLLPGNYVSETPGVASALDGFWAAPALAGVPRNGCSFWMEKR